MTTSQRYFTCATAVATASICGLLLAGCGSATDSGSGPAVGPSSAPTTAAAAPERGAACGSTRGPDGALYVFALGTASVDCAEAQRVATAFGPKIASGQPTTVEGWQCTFPQTKGLLARCDKGEQAIGFFSNP